MMKSQDVVVLLKLASLEDGEQESGQQPARHGVVMGEDPYSVRGPDTALGISKTEVSASIKRSLSSGIAVKDRKTGRRKANRRQFLEFIVHVRVSLIPGQRFR